ncbi:MAG TPA: Na+/H+ antiporter NhaC family protein [Longimicrobiales bacterium]
MSNTTPTTTLSETLGVEGQPAPVSPASGRRRKALGVVITAAAIVLALTLGGERPEGAAHYGFGSVLPALVTLTLVFVTREVVSSLFLGIVIGGLVSANYNIIDAYLLPAIGSQSYAIILLVYLWCLGGLIGLWTRTGGAKYFAEWAGQRMVRGPRSAAFFAWFMGIVFHQGGTISTILAGTTVRPVTDRERVSHEELSYIVDSTASPVASIIPLNAWPIYVAGLVVGTTPLFATEQDAISFFFRAVPFNFYSILAVFSTLLFALDLLPWEGRKMRMARLRSRATGELNAPGARPLSSEELTTLRVPRGYPTGLADFVLPLGILIGVAATGVVPALLAGDISRISVPIAEAFGLSVLSAIVLALLKGMSLQDAVDGFIDGAKGVTIGAIILGLAVTLGEVSRSLGTAAYIVELTAEALSPVVLPALFMLITMAISFSTGTSFGTYAVFFPIAMPLAWAVQPNDPFFLTLCFGAVVGGSVWGDQCSPISDTTILSAVATGSDLMDHVTTQLPLASAAAGISVVLYTLLAAFA